MAGPVRTVAVLLFAIAVAACTGSGDATPTTTSVPDDAQPASSSTTTTTTTGETTSSTTAPSTTTTTTEPPPPTGWTAAPPGPPGLIVFDVATDGEGRWVAAANVDTGETGNLPALVTWSETGETAATMATDITGTRWTDVFGIAWTGSRFVATLTGEVSLDGPAVAESDDGTVWDLLVIEPEAVEGPPPDPPDTGKRPQFPLSPSSSPANTNDALADGDTVFVGGWARDADDRIVPRVWTSDGDAWIEVRLPDPAEGSHTVERLGGGAGFLVAQGLRQWTDGRVTGSVWTSGDGIDWTLLDLEPAPFDSLLVTDVARGPGGLLVRAAAGPSSQLWVSADGGASWEPVPPTAFEAGAEVRVIASGPGGIIAAGCVDDAGAAAWLSDDGVTWERLEGNFGVSCLEAAAALGQGFAVGSVDPGGLLRVWATASDAP